MSHYRSQKKYQCPTTIVKKAQHTVLPRESSHIEIALKRLSMDQPNLGISKPVVKAIGGNFKLIN